MKRVPCDRDPPLNRKKKFIESQCGGHVACLKKGEGPDPQKMFQTEGGRWGAHAEASKMKVPQTSDGGGVKKKGKICAEPRRKRRETSEKGCLQSRQKKTVTGWA